MKFTEEQYQEIIKVWLSEAGYVKSIQAIVDYLSSIDMRFMIGEAVALANPRTREWAHEQFVEKEKKYVWRLKSDNTSVINKTVGVWFLDKTPSGIEYFSEKEIKNSPFKPEWFDKEEVE